MAKASVVLAKLQRKLLSRIRGIVRRGVANSVDSGGQMQTMRVSSLAERVADAVEHFEPYGFTSNPPSGSEGVVLAVGGDQSHLVGLAFGTRASRLSGLDSGEVAVYHPDGGSIIMRNDGSIEAVAAPGQTVNLGGVPPTALPVARQTDPVAVTSAALLTLKQAFDAWTPAPNDGGLALKTQLATFLGLSDSEVVQGSGTITAGGTGSTST